MNEQAIYEIYVIILFFGQVIMTGFVADSKGRSAGGWVWLAIFFPIVSMIAVGLAEPKIHQSTASANKQNHLEQYNAI